MNEEKRFKDSILCDEVEITEEVVKDPKALAEILNTQVRALLKPGGYVWKVREDSVLTKNVVNVLVKLLIQKGIIKKEEFKIGEWLPEAKKRERTHKKSGPVNFSDPEEVRRAIFFLDIVSFIAILD